MCANRNFRVVVNLSNFFHDHRNRARIFINDNIKKISDLADRIEQIFHIKNFHLTSQNDFLPPSEDVRILQNDEVIWVLQNGDQYDKSTCTSDIVSKKSIKKAHKKRSISPKKDYVDEELKSPKKKKKCTTNTEDEAMCILPSPRKEHKKKKEKSHIHVIIIEEEMSPAEKESSKKKKKKKLSLGETEHVDTKMSSPPNEELKMKKKKLHLNVNTQNGIKDTPTKQQNEVKEKTTDQVATTAKDETNGSKEGKIMKMNTLLPVLQSHISTYNKKINSQASKVNAASTNFSEIASTIAKRNDAEKESDDKKAEYCCNGDLSSYKKSVPLPTTTDQYLQKKKINIVKIEYLHKADKLVNSCNGNKTELVNCTPDTSINRDQNDDQGKPLEVDMSVDVGFDFIETSSSPEVRTGEVQTGESIGEGVTTEADARESPAIQKETCNESKKTSSNEEDECEQVVSENLENEYSSLKVMEIEEGTGEYLNVVNEAESSHENLETEYSALKEMEIEEGTGDNFNVINEAIEAVRHDMDTPEEPFGEDVDMDGSRREHNTSLTSDTGIESLPSLSGRASNECEGDDPDDLNNPLDDTIKASDNSMLDITKHDESFSSKMSSHSSRARVSGVGQLIADLRSNSSVPSEDNLNSDCNESIVKRQRKRVRRRKKKNEKGNTDSLESSLVIANGFTPPKPKSFKVNGGPTMHIKFEEGEGGNLIAVNKVSRRRNSLPECEPYAENSGIENITSNSYREETLHISEKDILKAPLIKLLRSPQAGDLIAFKMLIITENYTPGLSTQIVGKVLEYNQKSDEVTYEILSGLDQCDDGGLSIGADSNNYETKGNQRVIEWKDVIEARLLSA